MRLALALLLLLLGHAHALRLNSNGDGKKTTVSEDQEAELAEFAFKAQLKAGAGLGDVNEAIMRVCKGIAKRKVDELTKRGKVMEAVDVEVPQDLAAAEQSCKVTLADYKATLKEDSVQYEDDIVEGMLDKVDHPTLMEETLRRKMKASLEQGQEAVAGFLWQIFDHDNDGEVRPKDVLNACTKAKDAQPVFGGNPSLEQTLNRGKQLFLFSCTPCAKDVELGKKFFKAFKKYDQGGCDQL